MANADESEPVIVSSNRYNDIEPYTKKLFAEDSKTWSQILPWEFPQQNGQSKEQMKLEEETFLRQFFNDREIRMQGGADGDGNGFRFLKQVWYCAAMWNANVRLPAIVNWWFQNSQELLSDDNMKEHFFKPDVQPSTFFDSAEIKLYGEKLLGWAVKQIQFRLRPELIHQGQQTPTPAQAQQHQATKTLPTEDSQQIAPPLKTDMAINSAPKLAPTAKPYQALNSPALLDNALPQPQQTRSISGDTNPFSGQNELPSRKQRGPYNSKRNSFHHNRPDTRQLQPSSEYRHGPGPTTRFGDSTNAQIAYSPFVQARIPSGGPPAFTPRNTMPTVPQGQAIPTSSAASPHPPGAAMRHPHQALSTPFAPPANGPPSNSYVPGLYQPGSLQSSGFPPGHPGMPTDGFVTQDQPFVDRSNFSRDQPFSNHQQFFTGGSTAEARQRRESITSRGGGGKGRGYGSVRGRGSRGRNSFGQSHGMPSSMNFQPPDQQTWNAARGSDASQSTRRFSSHRDRDMQGQSWRAHNENTVPGMPTPMQDARFDNSAAANRDFGAREMAGGSGAHAYQQRIPQATFNPVRNGRKPYHKIVPLCNAGCTKENISDTCTTATKLVVFGSPDIDIKEYLEECGVQGLDYTSRPREPFRQGPSYAYISFSTVDATRRGLDILRRGMSWHTGQVISAEVAKEHWDPDHFTRTGESSDAQHVANPQLKPQGAFTPQPPTRIAHEVPPKPVLLGAPDGCSMGTAPKAAEQVADILSKDPVSVTTTPTASALSTPKKKKKPNASKKKNGQKNAQEDDKTEAESRKDSMIPTQDNHEKTLDSAVEEMLSTSSNHGAVASNTPDSSTAPAAHLEKGTAAKVVKGDAGDNSETSLAITEDLNSLHPAAKASLDGDQETATDGAQNKRVSSMGAKSSDEHVNDSFHTAGDSTPKQETNLVKSSEATDDASQATDKPVATSSVEQESTPRDVAGPSLSATDQADEVPTKAPTSSHSKKAPVPYIPKSRNVSIALPHLDTKAAAEIDKTEDTERQKVAQRTASNGSDVPAAGFVTAPTTPALPEPSSEQQSKKAAKAKGPVQTESLSIFGKKEKPKKPKKNKGGSVRGPPKHMGRISASPTPEFGASIVPAEMPAKSGDADRTSEQTLPAARDRAGSAVPVDNGPPQEAREPIPRRGTGILDNLRNMFHTGGTQGVQSSLVNRGATPPMTSDISSESGKTPAMLSKINVSAVGNESSSQIGHASSATEAPAEVDVKAEQEPQSDADLEKGAQGLGISNESSASKSKKKPKKKSKKGKKTAEVPGSPTNSQAAGTDAATPSPTSSEAGGATDNVPRSIGALSRLKMRGLDSKSRSAAKTAAAEPVPGGTNSPVTLVFLTQPSDVRQGQQPVQQGSIVEELDEAEQLSPEVVAAKERLARLRLEEEAAQQKKKKNKSADQVAHSAHSDE